MNDLLLICAAGILKMLIWVIYAPKVGVGMGFVQSDFLINVHCTCKSLSLFVNITIFLYIAKSTCSFCST